MSNPGQNGFSLRASDLEAHAGLRQLIEEAVGWGDLYEMDHTSKIKSDRASDPRKKYYTKEPVYAKLDDILNLARAAGAVTDQAPLSHTTRPAADPNQPWLFPEES